MNQNNQDSHKRFLSFYKYLAAVFPVFAAVIALTFFAAMLADYDSTIGHFANGSVPYIITVIGVGVSAVLGFAGLFLSKKSASLTKDPAENPVTVFGAVMCAFLSFACMISTAADYSLGILSKFAVIYALLIPFTGISMILSLIGKLNFSAVRKISAILAVLAVNVSMFADYFDFTLPLNSPVRNFVTVMKAAALLYLLSEARFAFGAESKRLTLPATVLASGAAASITLGCSAGAILTSLFAGIASNPNPPIFELGFYAAIGIHAAGRLFTIIPAIGEYIPPVDEKKKEADKEKSTKKNN